MFIVDLDFDVDKFGWVDEFVNGVGNEGVFLLLVYWRLKVIVSFFFEFGKWW